MQKIAMLGTGLIGRFYTMSLQNIRGNNEIKIVCSSKLENAKKFAEEFGIPRWTDDMATAIQDPEIDTVIVGIPNYLHKKAVLLAAEAGKAVLCTKPLAISGPEAFEMLEAGFLNFLELPSQLKSSVVCRQNRLDVMQPVPWSW